MIAAGQGCSCAFINVSPVFTDPKGEAKHGQNVVDACLQAGVKHVILSSVPHLCKIDDLIRTGAVNPTLAYRASKIAVKRSVIEAGFESWTILQLPRLLSSFVDPLSRFVFPKLASEGIIKTSLRADLRQSVLDPADIGRAVAAIISDEQNRFKNGKLALEGEQLTFREIVGAMNEVLGEERVKLEQIEEDEARELAQRGGLILAGEALFNDNPSMLVVDDAYHFGFRMCNAKKYLLREKEALEWGVGMR